jgi:rfaE bifunctional protein nucleotidyltransferase chain/domain
MKKIRSLSEWVLFRKQLAKKRKKLVFTNGCFDILHFGHASYLAKARALGDFLIVALNSDASVRRLKGKNRPVFSQSDRANVLAALSCVDGVVIFSSPTPLQLIQALKPDVLVKGADWPLKKIVGFDLVTSYGGKVRQIAFEKGRSTSRVIRKINAL